MADAIVQSYLENFYRKHVFSGGVDGQMLVQDSNSASGAGWSSGPTLTDMTLGASGTLAWSTDLKLTRDAANTLAQRNSTNAQALRIYGTFTDSSNYERLNINYSGSAYRIQGEHAGTGASRNIIIQAPSSLVMRTSGSATEGWEIVAGVFRAITDNTYDIGASGANRPRNVFVGTDITVAGSYLGSAGIQAGASSTFVWSARSRMSSQSDGTIMLTNNALTDFTMLRWGGSSSAFPALKRSAAELQLRLADDSAAAVIRGHFTIGQSNNLNTATTGSTTLLIAGTAPTISSGFGTSPSIASNNGTAAFTVNVGTGGTATAGVVGLPAATTGWIVSVSAPGQPAHYTRQTASTTTTATLSNYNSAGTLTAWPASTVLNCVAMAY